mmetsp:Transcript_70291/g.217401  ORF Transcript_70291/g.217401 Transcript_70291/m.217401 type:complete len:213 (+) Transcript_70291:1071-1709(+)
MPQPRAADVDRRVHARHQHIDVARDCVHDAVLGHELVEYDDLGVLPQLQRLFDVALEALAKAGRHGRATATLERKRQGSLARRDSEDASRMHKLCELGAQAERHRTDDSADSGAVKHPGDDHRVIWPRGMDEGYVDAPAPAAGVALLPSAHIHGQAVDALQQVHGASVVQVPGNCDNVHGLPVHLGAQRPRRELASPPAALATQTQRTGCGC